MRETMKKRFTVLMGAALLTVAGGLALPATSGKAETSAASELSAALTDGGIPSAIVAAGAKGSVPAVLTAGAGSGIVTTAAVAPASGGGVSAGNAEADSGAQTNDGESRTYGYADLLLRHYIARIADYAAAFASSDYDAFMQDFQEGQSLAEASGLSKAELADKLVGAFEQRLEAEVRAGTLTTDEATQASAEASMAILGAVSAEQGQAKLPSDGIDGRDIRNAHIHSIVQTVAFLYELDARELKEALRDGSNLAEASGQSAEDLTSAIAERLDRELEAAVRAGQLSETAANERRAEGTEAIRTIVTTAGYDPDETVWMRQFGDRLLRGELGFAVPLAAAHAGIDINDVLAALAGGETLLSASGLSETELLDLLGERVGLAIEQAWLDGKLSANMAERLRAEADVQIKAVIHTVGYGIAAPSGDTGRTEREKAVPVSSVTSAVYDEETGTEILVKALDAEYLPVDPKAYTEAKLGEALQDIAALSATSYGTLLERLAEGQSMAAASGVSNESLLLELVRSTSKQLNEYVANGQLNEQESVQVKSNYIAGLIAMLAKP